MACTCSPLSSRLCSAASSARRDSIAPAGTSVNGISRQRLRIVGNSLCGSVVASTKTTPGGGSSRVFSRAEAAAWLSRWHSSSTSTRVWPGATGIEASATNCLI